MFYFNHGCLEEIERTWKDKTRLPYFPDSWTPGMYMIQGGGSRTPAILEIFLRFHSHSTINLIVKFMFNIGVVEKGWSH